MTILGIHHITAIASDTEATNTFYTEVLGLRLVKKTVHSASIASTMCRRG